MDIYWDNDDGWDISNMIYISKSGLDSLIHQFKELEIYKKAYEILINEVALERWTPDGEKAQLYEFYLERARKINEGK